MQLGALQIMGDLLHKVGLILDLNEPLKSGHRKHITQGISALAGVISADFNEAQGDMLIVEYEPSRISPAELQKNVREINRTIAVRTAFVSRPSPED